MQGKEAVVSHQYEQAAVSILLWLHKAEDELVGKTVAMFNGEVGTLRALTLDADHGLCFTIDEQITPNLDGVMPLGQSRRYYPVSTIKVFT